MIVNLLTNLRRIYVETDLASYKNLDVLLTEDSEVEMSSITDNDPTIQQAFEQLDRFYTDPKLMELDRQRRLAMFDQMAANAIEAKAKAELIILTLSRRFNEVPQEIQGKLLDLVDIDQINDLANFAFDCQSPEEFASHLH